MENKQNVMNEKGAECMEIGSANSFYLWFERWNFGRFGLWN
ncbi:MAG: hypothetical protein PHT54_04270 [Candidatus Nanoarchaeia archaeon]|nr:hypothetical protein [Candidatus Nanoarchaeia archaeon]